MEAKPSNMPGKPSVTELYPSTTPQIYIISKPSMLHPLCTPSTWEAEFGDSEFKSNQSNVESLFHNK